MITSMIYSWIYNKNEIDYKDIDMELKKLDKIDLNNFVGKIKIIKGNENRLKILNSNIESIVKYDEEKGELIVSQIGKVFFSEKYKSILELEYSEESLDVKIKNNIFISPESKLNMSIFNVVGKVVIGDGKDA